MIRHMFALVMLVALGAQAQLQAVALGGSSGDANLVQSRLRVTVGAQWLDVEEDAELGASRNAASASGTSVWQIAGEVTLPAHAVVTSCLLWNGDTLLMGKLRGQADAEHKYDSIVPPLPAGWPKDPLLIQQTGGNTYSIKLYPVWQGGTRHIRIRYLVPVEAFDGSVSVLPILSQVNGAKPSQWTFELRGKHDVTLGIDGTIWPMSPPALRVYPFPQGNVYLRWDGSTSPNGSRALRNHTDAGSWSGDFVLYQGTLPDSMVRKVERRSELVVLWRWVKPHTFLVGQADCSGCGTLTDDGAKLVAQASQILSQLRRLAGRGNKVSLVVDDDLGGGLKTFALGDSASGSYQSMQAWLSGVGEDWLKTVIPTHGSVVETNPAALELSRNRDGFRTDVQSAALQFSADTAAVQELMVVTAGPVPDATSFEETLAVGLPTNVSAQASDLILPEGEAISGEGAWPGVSLASFTKSHPGRGGLVNVGGANVPALRDRMAVTVSVQSDKGMLASDVILDRGTRGEWSANFNVHSRTLARLMTWKLLGDSAKLLATWNDQPDWVETTNDSALPRLWAHSATHQSSVFPNDKSLGPYFGIVDQQYSLLAIPSDTLGAWYRSAYADSGVPYLRGQDIFAKTGYNDETITGIRAIRSLHDNFTARRLQGGRSVMISYEGIDAKGLVIRDLRGRVVARWDAVELAGRMSMSWNGRDLTGRASGSGVYLITLATAQGSRTATVAIP
jgi:hypothetical protein